MRHGILTVFTENPRELGDAAAGGLISSRRMSRVKSTSSSDAPDYYLRHLGRLGSFRLETGRVTRGTTWWCPVGISSWRRVGIAFDVLDSAPTTRIKPRDARTGRFLELVAAWMDFVGGSGLDERDRPLFWPILEMARSTADAYQAGDTKVADRSFLTLSNLVARHPRAPPLIAKWKELWKLSKDTDASAEAVQRLREAADADRRRLGAAHGRDFPEDA